jgi:hypothetical protein
MQDFLSSMSFIAEVSLVGLLAICMHPTTRFLASLILNVDPGANQWFGPEFRNHESGFQIRGSDL